MQLMESTLSLGMELLVEQMFKEESIESFSGQRDSDGFLPLERMGNLLLTMEMMIKLVKKLIQVVKKIEKDGNIG
jgi:hypothetical protein